MTPRTAKAIEVWGGKLDIPPGLLDALAQVESAGNNLAMRYERGYRWLWDCDLGAPYRGDWTWGIPAIPGSSRETELVGQQTSWGVLQIMGATARSLGFRGWFPALCAEPGVIYGARYLAHLYERYPDWMDAIAAYNAGSPRRGPEGRYVNQHYVDKVLRVWHSR